MKVLPDVRALDPGSVHEACDADRPPAVSGAGHGPRLGPVFRAARAAHAWRTAPSWTPGSRRRRVRSLGGWATVHALRRGREHYAADERVLGCSAFVEALVSRVCAAVRLAPTALQESGLFPDDYSATKLSSRGDQHSRCGASIAVSLLDDLVCPVLPFYADSVSI